MSKTKKLTALIITCVLCFVTAITLISYNAARYDSFAAEAVKVEMIDGAEIRVADGNQSGLRFIGKAEKTLFGNTETPELNDGVTVGMLVIPQSLLDGELTLDTAAAQNRVIEKWDTARSDETFMRFNVAITEIPQEYYGTAVAARAYVTENGITTYSAKTVVRSVAQVASIALAENVADEDGTIKAFVDGANPTLGVKINGETVELSALNGKKLELNDKLEFSVSPSALIVKVDGEENNFKNTATNSYLASVSGNVNLTVSLGSINQTAAIEVAASDISFGIGEVTSELYNGLADSGKTAEYVAQAYGVMGAKTTRIWIYQGYFFGSDNNDNIWLNSGNVAKLHNYLAELKANGVVNIIGTFCEYLKPYKFNQSIKDGVGKGTSVPLPSDDNYKAFLNMNTAAYYLLAREFPEIIYWEAGNEPSISEWFHDKDGNAIDAQTTAQIVADYCFAARRGIKMASDLNKLLTPGLVDGADLNAFLGYLYDYIENNETSVNPDDYFDYLSWHPYPHATANGDVTNFTSKEKALYAIVNARDAGRQVIYTEFGFSDSRFEGEATQDQIANYAVNAVKAIKADAELKDFVKSVVWFRLADNISSDDSSDFGLFTSPNATTKAYNPKPIAEELYRYYNNTDDTNPLYWKVPKPSELSEEYLCGIMTTGAMMTGSATYSLSEVTDGFLDNNARVGMQFEKTSTANAYSTYEFKTDKVLEAGAKYTLKFRIHDHVEGGICYAGFRIGIKDVFISSQGSFPPSGYDYKNGYVAAVDNKISGISCSRNYETITGIYSTERYINNYSIEFTVGSADISDIVFELNVNFGAKTGKVILSNIELIKYEIQREEKLGGINIKDYPKTEGSVYNFSIVNSGFHPDDTEATIGLQIDKTVETNTMCNFKVSTGKKLETGKTYKFSYRVTRFDANANPYSGFLLSVADVFKPANSSYPTHPWCFEDGSRIIADTKGDTISNVSYDQKDNPAGSKVSLFTCTLNFTVKENIEDANLWFVVNFQANTGKILVSNITIAEVTE